MKKVYTRVPSHGDIDTKHDTSNLIAAAAEAEHHGGDGVKPIAIASRQAFDAAQIKFVHALIDKLVAEGRVEECVSKWSSPIRVFRDGADTLMAVDYANTVNAHTAGRHSRWPQIRETLQDARWRIGEHGMQWGNALADAEVAAVLAFSVPHRTAPFTWKFVPHGVAFRPLIPDFRNFIVYAAPSTDPDNDPDDAGGGVESGGDVECAVTNCIVSEHSAKLLLKAKDINTIKPPLSEDIEAINQESTSTINQESTSTFAKLPAAKQKKKPLTKFKAKDFNASRNACAHKFGMQDPTQSAETAVRRWFNSFDNETLLDECRKHKEVAVASIAPLIYNAAITVNIPAVSRASKIILTFVQHDFVTAADIFSSLPIVLSSFAEIHSAENWPIAHIGTFFGALTGIDREAFKISVVGDILQEYVHLKAGSSYVGPLILYKALSTMRAIYGNSCATEYFNDEKLDLTRFWPISERSESTIQNWKEENFLSWYL